MKNLRFYLSCLLILGGVLFVVNPTMVKATDNLLANPNFESWTNSTTINDWGVMIAPLEDSNYSQETTLVTSGSSSVKITKYWGDNNVIFYQELIVTSGQNYTFSAWVYENVQANVWLSLDYNNVNSDYVVSSNIVGWQQLSVTVEADSSLARVEIFIQYISPGAPKVCYIDAAGFNVGNSPIDTLFPVITILDPLNSTYFTSTLELNYILDENASWVGYSLDGDLNVTITGNVTLSSLSEGTHKVVMYANDSVGNMGISPVIWFTVDALPPIITIKSPANGTYLSDTVWLIVDLDEPASWIGYSLDDAINITMTDDILLEGLSEGIHSLTVFANDSGNKIGFNVVYFTIHFPSNSTTPTTTLTPNTIWITYTTILPLTTWVTQSKNTAEFATLAIFAGFVGIIWMRRRKRK